MCDEAFRDSANQICSDSSYNTSMLCSFDVYVDWQIRTTSFFKILIRVRSSGLRYFFASMGWCICSKRQKNKMDDLYYFSCTTWTFIRLPDVSFCFNGWSILVMGFLHPYCFDRPFYLCAALNKTKIPSNWKKPRQKCSFKKTLIINCKHWRSLIWDWSLALKFKTSWPIRTIQYRTYRSRRTSDSKL